MSTAGTIHQVLLADWLGLVKLWDVPSDKMGLRITKEGDLVPIRLEPGTSGKVTLKQLLEKAKKQFPRSDSSFDVVVNIFNPTEGNLDVKLLTVDESLEPGEDVKTKWTFRWWTFTDDYKSRMH